MNVRDRLDAIVAKRDLLQHPFYQAWNRGELPMEALATYAREYGAFVSRVAMGWAAHGDNDIAAEEREHAEIWGDFAAALGTEIGEPEVPQVKTLVDTVDRRYVTAAGSMGGLYAFEAQQPNTSTSKLKGLKEHYGTLGSKAEKYFEIHENDVEEPALLAQRIESLDEAGQTEALESCEEVAICLWDALTGICEKHGVGVAQA